MSSDQEPKWPTYNVGGSRNHIHAIGVVAVNYNSLEMILDLILYEYMGVPDKVQSHLFANLTRPAQVGLLNACTKYNEGDKELADHVTYFARCFSICAGNRDALMHARVDHNTTTREILAMEKKSKGKPNITNQFQFKLDDIRRVADEMHEIYMYGARLTVIKHLLNDEEEEETPLYDLPDKPPLPKDLNPQIHQPAKS